MLSKSRPSVLIIGLTVIMAIPVAAGAKPTSSFVLAMSGTAGGAVSVEVEFDDVGVSNFHFQHTEVQFIVCSTGSGTVITNRVADGPAVASEVAVTRKLDDLTITGSVQVSQTISTYCTETGLVEQSSLSTESFELAGVATERLRRARLNGARVLSSTLDPLTFSLSDLSVTGVGMLTETITK